MLLKNLMCEISEMPVWVYVPKPTAHKCSHETKHEFPANAVSKLILKGTTRFPPPLICYVSFGFQ